MDFHDENEDYIKDLIKKFDFNYFNLKIEKIIIEPGSNEGDNYMSVVKRIIVNGKFENNEKEINKSFIIKRQIPSASRRKLFRCDEAFSNEIAAYNHIIPLLKRFSKNNLPYPKCIYAGSDHTGDVIFLEDLKSNGYQMVNRVIGLNYDQCKLIMQELANLHSISFAIKACNEEILLNAKNEINEIIYCSDASEFYTHSLESSLNEALSSLNNSNQNNCLTSAIEKLKRLSGQLYNIMYSHVVDDSNKWHVICHGDVWINNMMFKRNHNENHKNNFQSLKLIDLQAMRFGSPILDILHFIYSCTERSLRKKYLNQLIIDYHLSLISSLKSYLYCTDDNKFDYLNKIEKRFSVENIKNEISEKALYGLGVSMWLLPAITFHPDCIPDLNKIELTHFTSREQEKAMTQMQTEHYHRRMKDIVLEFEECGYLDKI